MLNNMQDAIDDFHMHIDKQIQNLKYARSYIDGLLPFRIAVW